MKASHSNSAAAGVSAEQTAEQTAESNAHAPRTANTLPYLQGAYDPLEHRNLKHFSRIISENGNQGEAFSVNIRGEDRVVAVVYTNNVTMHAQKQNISDILAQREQPEVPAVDRQRVWIRGAVLNGLGNPADFTGTNSLMRMNEEEKAYQLKVLREENPRLANLIENRHAYVDIFVGEKRGFIQGVSLPLNQLAATIRDLTNANCSYSKTQGKDAQQHVGSLRCAEILEASMRIFEKSGVIPPMGEPKQIAISRYVADNKDKVDGRGALEEPPY